jgi:hypothetical protein
LFLPLSLVALTPSFAVCRLPASAAVPTWTAGGPFTSVSRTPDELSIVCLQDSVPDDVPCERCWRCLRVAGTVAFSAIGVLASLSVPLAEAGIALFAVSTFDTDYLLVKEKDFERTVSVLRQAGHAVA